MNLKSLSLYVILSFVIFSCAPEARVSTKGEIKNVFGNEFLAKIHTHKDLRDTKWLIANLDTASAEDLKHILNAIASCKDSSALEPILKRVVKKDVDESEFLTAMNAVVNLAPTGSSQRLIDFSSSLNEGAKLESVLVAIGSTGSMEGHNFLLNRKLSEGTIQGIYRSFLKGNKDIETIEKAIHGISNENTTIRYWSAHILNRQRDQDLTSYFQKLKFAFENEKDEAVKIPLAGSFKKVIGEEKSLFLRDQLSLEENPLVLINLLRALDKSDFANNYKSAIKLGGHNTEQVAVTSVGYLGRNYDPVLKNDLVVLEESTKNDVVKAEIYKVLAAEKDPDIISKAMKLFNETKNISLKGVLISVMANDAQNKDWIIQIFNDESLPVLQGIAHQSILDICSENEKSEFINLGINSSNVALICQSAAAIREVETNHPNAKEWIDLMQEKKSVLELPRQLEAYVELRKSIGYLNKETVEEFKPEYNNPLSWKLIMKLPNRPKIELKTSKGIIEWELFLDEIPGAVSTIVNLIDSGYYNNKIFHRVVPNFVAQGGCPRGDGWGSLDFSLRSEYAQNVDYTKGAIGLASAGENTESCQFFMCHSATPLLDDRYTVIGRVTKGLEVLNSIGLGDTIESMKRLN